MCQMGIIFIHHSTYWLPSWYWGRNVNSTSIISYIRDKERHAWLRKGMLPGFSPKSLLEYELTLQMYIHHFITGVTKCAEINNGIVYMSDWFGFFSFDVFPVSVSLISDHWIVSC